jgi:hypothetical protein
MIMVVPREFWDMCVVETRIIIVPAAQQCHVEGDPMGALRNASVQVSAAS